MTTEIGAMNSYAAVLADLRAKRDEIDKTIKTLEGLSGLSLSAGVGLASATSSATGHGIAVRHGADKLDAGEFLGMSIADAAKKLLLKRNRKMGNTEIATDLVAGGLVMTGKDPINVVGSVLTRRFNQVGDIVKVGRGVWGLKEWYPNQSFKPSTKGSSSIGAPKPGISDDGEPDSECNSSGDEFDDLIR